MAENLETAAEEAVSAGQGESVDAQTETLNAEASAGAGQPGAVDGQSKEPQTRAENAAFKRMRQRMEALERENAAFRAERQGEVEDAGGVRETQEPSQEAAAPAGSDEADRLRQENAGFRQQLLRYRQMQELAELRAHDPALSVQSIGELGETYLRLRCAGVGNLAAYEAVKRAEGAGKPVPPDTGAVGLDTCQEKTYYSPADVDRLSARELDDPKIMERVMQSMTKWRK